MAPGFHYSKQIGMGDEKHAVGVILFFTIFTLVIPATLWYLGTVKRQPQLKKWAVVIFVVPLLVFGYNFLAERLGWDGSNTFRTSVSGPPRRGPVAPTELPYHVNHEGWRQVVELTPIARVGEIAKGPVTLKFEARSPSAAVVANATATLEPDKGKNWSTLRTEFIAPAEGDYSLKIEIPTLVGEVKLTIREVKP